MSATEIAIRHFSAAVAEAEPEVEMAAAPIETAVAQPATGAVAENGASISKPVPAAAPRPAPKPKTEEAVAVPALTPQEMNRREFLSTAAATSTGALGAPGALRAAYVFLLPFHFLQQLSQQFDGFFHFRRGLSGRPSAKADRTIVTDSANVCHDVPLSK